MTEDFSYQRLETIFSQEDPLENTLIKTQSLELNGNKSKNFSNGAFSPLKNFDSKEDGFFKKYLSSIFANLTLVVDTIHIRFEDEIYPFLHPYSISIVMDNFNIKTSSYEWFLDDNAEVKKRGWKKKTIVKEGKIKGLGVYITSMDGMLIPTSL